MDLNIVLKMVLLFTLQTSHLLNQVISSPVKLNHTSAVTKQRVEDQSLSNQLRDNALTSSTFPNKDEQNPTAASTAANKYDIFSRHLRSTRNPCVKKKVHKYNSCLEEFFVDFHCRKQHFGCLPFNAPPRCKKNFELRYGKTGKPCIVVSGCECAT
ncbi:uncharacterized protein LOC114956921 [Acropora millepora]|uniref:uncharacterized protein LOC114956921 n=1 Tax=Acropora millepora TaxID=45264 RepID=UPI001CF328ED|nr:uncharacterized protein LOC114956921 [Acropora millepora]